jgi:hypothetical protein
MTPTIHLLCAVHNGARFLPALLESLAEQTHREWILWMLDDHSRDDSAAVMAVAASRDPRVRVVSPAPAPLGAVGAFARLWELAPPEARYLAFADQDDVWLPHKLATSLAALQRAEGTESTAPPRPALVHTDLEVVGPALEPMAPSYWRYAGVVPEPATFRRVAAQNVVTGCTVLVNGALRQVVGSIPPGATMHDAWVASVAAALGQVVTLYEPTVRYRQHGGNTLGARQAGSQSPWHQRFARIWRALTHQAPIRRQLAAAAAQAKLLAAQYGDRLGAEDRDFLHALAQIPRMPWWDRKRAVARYYLHPEHERIRRLGVLWRA